MGGDDKFFWTPGSDITIEDYVKKYRPSIFTDDDTPWIWVKGSDGDKKDPETESGTAQSGALVEAGRILNDLEVRLSEIETDDSIPTRAKKGQKSKKAVRDEAHEGTKESLKNLSKASKWTIGKWLMFPKHEMVDRTWSTIAQSVAAGPLRDAGVILAKVAPTPSSPPGDVITHVICMYMEDVYDLKTVRKVLKTLIKTHGLEPSAVKSDLYTLAGIDSNHATKLRSSIWRPHEVIEVGNDGIKKLKDEYQANKQAKGDDDADAGDEGGKKEKGRVGRDGIIESDSDDEVISKKRKTAKAVPEEGAMKTEAEGGPKETNDGPAKKAAKQSAAPIKHKPSQAMKFKDQDIFAGGSDTE